MNDTILEAETVKYQVVLNGSVLHGPTSKGLAENFVMSLTEEQRNNVQIIPVTDNGQQILLG